jgi:IS1 family transposase
MWSFVHSKQQQRWLWHAIDHATGEVLAYVLSNHQDTAFLELKSLLEPFGIMQLYMDGWGAYVGVACRMRYVTLTRHCTRLAKPILKRLNVSIF